MKFKTFILDKFQEDSIIAIENEKSVLVSAPTGSGKTLIADYIIDKFLKENSRIIYTAPIKALSNQKYKEFTESYGEDKIGLITGDLVINPEAQVLIMTAEVYRNMAIINDHTLDSVAYCIMDEIHFISDQERGHVWEESIIFSPEHVKFLFLSATIPNSDEFASWVESIKNTPVEIIKSDVRPVPLERKFYDSERGITTLDEIKERKELDKYPGYHQFMKGRHGSERVPKPDFRNLIAELGDRLPCIYFVFSRAKTMDYASTLANKKQFLSIEEQKKTIVIISREFNNLNKELLSLKSTQKLRECLPKGIAFHNAGILPELKHIVEKLFSEGLIKVLFATETFAVGINMPAKTVCFDSLRKYTDTGFRYLTSKEYFQISGRAGRRGIDKQGLSVAMIYRPSADIDRIKEFTTEDKLPLKSQFKLTYNTILNLINQHKPEENTKILTMNFLTYQKLKGTKSNRVLGSIKARFTKATNLLTQLGYIKNDKLTQLGLFTTKIFGNELEVSQIFNGEIELDEYSILLLLASLEYEGKRETRFYKTYENSDSRKLFNQIQNNPVLRKGAWSQNINKMTAIIYPLYHQKKFFEVLKNSNLLEGDLIRILMRIMDKLEQIGKASNNEKQIMMIINCKELIKDSLEGIHLF
ncbi:MAG: DEAD/DEAH box helicase [Nanoarchaeota archaeon]|nr:DEAD/DEAH box helicase [Nanoarchaeota archaeon]MBU1030892.1 DEAD/DEAH box helicase [Nanoarchaeota archaeon]MBU1849454.1 DEAD/DEAH box helicase [Nanoarchaeota archaeon]